MSGLPDQDEFTDRLYTADDVQHIVAREMARRQIEQLQNGQLETNKRLVEMTAAFNAELKSLREMIASQPAQVDACRSELRHEIERDFPGRIEFLELEDKVDRQWLKITMILGTLSTVITGAGVAMNYWLMVSRISGG